MRRAASAAEPSVLMIAVVVSVEIYAIVPVVRSSLRKKWAWILLTLVGVTQLSLVWGSGAAEYSPLSVSLFGFSALKHGTGPWILSVSLPIGVILRVRKVKAANEAAEFKSIGAADVAAVGQSDHAV